MKNKTSSKRAQEKESVHQKHKSSYESKITHERFKGVTEQIGGDATCNWLKKEYLKKRNKKNDNISPRPDFKHQ